MIVVYNYKKKSILVDYESCSYSDDPVIVVAYVNAIQAMVSKNDFNRIQDYCVRHKYAQI
jgi:hypothetical protein